MRSHYVPSTPDFSCIEWCYHFIVNGNIDTVQRYCICNISLINLLLMDSTVVHFLMISLLLIVIEVVPGVTEPEQAVIVQGLIGLTGSAGLVLRVHFFPNLSPSVSRSGLSLMRTPSYIGIRVSIIYPYLLTQCRVV